MKAQIILYVRDQELSRQFYAAVLGQEPSLHVPGMTEFTINENCVLGLMPEEGIKRLLGDGLPDPKAGAGIPRAELYLHVDKPDVYHERAIKAGAREISGPKPRDWGDMVAYSLDPDGHVIAFACRL